MSAIRSDAASGGPVRDEGVLEWWPDRAEAAGILTAGWGWGVAAGTALGAPAPEAQMSSRVALSPVLSSAQPGSEWTLPAHWLHVLGCMQQLRNAAAEGAEAEPL